MDEELWRKHQEKDWRQSGKPGGKYWQSYKQKQTVRKNDDETVWEGLEKFEKEAQSSRKGQQSLGKREQSFEKDKHLRMSSQPVESH